LDRIVGFALAHFASSPLNIVRARLREV
jgi:hypothetical protein